MTGQTDSRCLPCREFDHARCTSATCSCCGDKPAADDGLDGPDGRRACWCFKRQPCVSQQKDSRAVVHFQAPSGWWGEHATDGEPETRVYSDEWDHEFTMPGLLSLPQLGRLLDLLDASYVRGKAAGRRHLQAEVRELLGAAAPPPDEE